MPRESDQPGTVAKVYLTCLAVLLGVIGGVIGVGGVWLILLDGSWYYAVAGLGMIGCAALLGQRRMLGVWLYAAIFGATVLWAPWERGLSGWAREPRLMGPAILMILILFAVPVLRRGVPGRWQSSAAGVALALVGLIALAQPNALTAQTDTGAAAEAGTAGGDRP